MKIVTVITKTEIDGKVYFPGVGVVSDAVATALDDLNALSGAAVDYRAPNPFGQMVFRGAYSGSTAYVTGDVVTEGGGAFVAITDSLGESTADTDFFEPLALEGGAEIGDLLNAIPVGNVPILGAAANLTALVPVAANPSGSSATLSTSNTYTDAAVKTAIDGAVDALKDKIVTALGAKADNADAETLRTEVEARLDAAEAKIDAVIGVLSDSKIMAAS